MTARVNTYRARIFADFALDPAPTYRRYIDRHKPQPRKGWSLFVKVCERLTRDGVDFAVTLDPALGEIRIVGTWTKARKSKQPAFPRMALPAPMKPETCRLQATAAERLLSGATGWLPDRSLRRMVDHMATRNRTDDAALYRELLTAELEHWREMELAAETRYTYRPGLTEERFAEDEEVLCVT